MRSNSLEKLRALSLISATLGIAYATQCYVPADVHCFMRFSHAAGKLFISVSPLKNPSKIAIAVEDRDYKEET